MCKKGLFSPEDGLSECLSCDSGMYVDKDGATSCWLCEAGKTTEEQKGAVSCTGNCEDGMYKTATMSRCSKCDAGKFSKDGADAAW